MSVVEQQLPLFIINNLITSIIWVNKHQLVTYLNVAASELLQMSESRVVGRNWDSLLPELKNCLAECGTGRLTVHELPINLVDGTKIRITCVISYIEYEVEKGWLVEMTNTERHHKIVEEDERWNQYEAGNILAKTLAHEVKNPLAGIYGATQLLQMRFKEISEIYNKAQPFLEVILNEVQRLKNLVDRMLGPETTMAKKPYNIHELIRYVLDIIQAEKPDNIAIRLDYDPSIPEISMDFEGMVQALLNILQNALQAMESHGGFLTIRTRVESKFTLGSKTYPLVAVLSVIDDGVGILPEFFDAIFYPMVTSKKEGTGLGLSVAQNIVRKHGGLIVAERLPKNTVFHIYLPFDHNRSSSRLLEK